MRYRAGCRLAEMVARLGGGRASPGNRSDNHQGCQNENPKPQGHWVKGYTPRHATGVCAVLVNFLRGLDPGLPDHVGGTSFPPDRRGASMRESQPPATENLEDDESNFSSKSRPVDQGHSENATK